MTEGSDSIRVLFCKQLADELVDVQPMNNQPLFALKKEPLKLTEDELMQKVNDEAWELMQKRLKGYCV